MTHKIKSLAEDDRPREKLANKGSQALSDAELLAILIGSGSRSESAVDLCRRILKDASNNLRELSRISIPQLMQYKGIGEAKAITIAAALELGRRQQATDPLDRPRITCSRDAFRVIGPALQDLGHEEFWVLLLSNSGQLLRKEQIGSGGIKQVSVDIRMIFKSALEHMAVSIILIHNHPSGGLKPSSQDLDITKKIFEAGKVLDIQIMDHLIISSNGYLSMADEGLI